jgi:hypothetical protein
MEDVEKGRVDRMDISSSEIFEKMVDFGQGAGDMAAILEIDKRQLFCGVGVIKREASLFKAGQQGPGRRE